MGKLFPSNPQVQAQKEQETPLTPPSDEEKSQLLTALKSATEKRDYAQFGILIKKVYEHRWISEKDFYETESKAYVNATNELFEKGKLDESLKVSTDIYNLTPSGWRFRYLRVRTLERLGRQALEKKDLDKAESYVQTMFKIMFRPEGADLLADIYMVRINDALAAKDLKKAQELYAFIKDYEISAIPRKKLDELAKKLGV